MMEIWDLHIGWFILGTFTVLVTVIISMERICYKAEQEYFNNLREDNKQWEKGD